MHLVAGFQMQPAAVAMGGKMWGGNRSRRSRRRSKRSRRSRSRRSRSSRSSRSRTRTRTTAALVGYITTTRRRTRRWWWGMRRRGGGGENDDDDDDNDGEEQEDENERGLHMRLHNHFSNQWVCSSILTIRAPPPSYAHSTTLTNHTPV
jgi:hypothetical protein